MNRVSIIILIFIHTLVPHLAQAYAVPAHKALSTNIYSEYNRLNPSKILTKSDLVSLLSGAEHEDDDPRYLHHFYDPINTYYWALGDTVVIPHLNI